MPKTIPVWILTIDHRHGTDSSAHASREEAVHNAATFAMNWWEERADKNDALDPNRMTNDQIVEAYFTDHAEEFYAITESSITIPEPGDDHDAARDEKIREMARDQHHRDGEVEIDDKALVSEGDDNGAYVAAWVWTDFTDTDLDKEKEEEEVDTSDIPEAGPEFFEGAKLTLPEGKP